MAKKLRPRETSPKKSATFNWETPAWILVGLIAFAARLISLLHAGIVQESALLVGDAVTYDAWASRIAGGDWIGEGVFYQAPLYPYFLGVIYSLFGRDFFVVRLIQILLGAGSCMLLARAGRSFFGRAQTGLLAGLLLAIYPTAIFFDCSIQKSVLDLFFVCALLAVIGKLYERAHKRLWLAAGAVVGLLALTRENALILFPLLLAWLFITWRGESLKRRLAWTGLLLLGLGAVLLPVGFRNLVAGGGFHLTTSQSGPNFYIGNSRAATGTYVPLREGRGTALFERDDARDLAEQATGRKLTPSEVSHYWTERAFDEIRADIPGWLRLMFRKWLLVWNMREVGDSDDQYTYGDWSPLVGALTPLLHFGTLCPFAIFGICLTWNRRRQIWLLYAMLFVYAGSVVLFYIFARYRFPLVPLLILFAAAGLTYLRDAFREACWKPLWTGAAAALVAAVACNYGMTSEALVRADTHINLGNALILEKKLPEAIGQYEQALHLNPGDPYVPFNLAAALLQEGRFEEAARYYEHALRIETGDARAHFNLGLALLNLGQPDQAIGHFEQALRMDPAYAEARVILGSVLFDRGNLPEAKSHWQQALQLKPTFAEAHYNLGNAFLKEGRLQNAMEHYRQAIRIKPEFADAYCNYGIALERAGRTREAIEQYEQAVLLRPDLTELQKRLDLLRELQARQAR